MNNWLLYGAYGYTGRLIIEEAVQRGHKPVLAGRNKDKLIPLAKLYDLGWLELGLDDGDKLATAVAPFDLVFHAAGPFTITSDPMLRACLAGKTHYVDITGEIGVFENTFHYDEAARQNNLVFISGVGFDVVPSDCLANYVADKLPDATELELAIAALGSASAGTTNTMLELLPTLKKGSVVRRNGRYQSHSIGQDAKQVTFSNGRTRTVTPLPWGDLATAYRSTGIPNITTYMILPVSPTMARFFRLYRPLLAIKPVRRLAQTIVARNVTGPDETARQTGRSYLYARATNQRGTAVEAWLETMEGYQLTAVAGVRAVEKILNGETTAGTLTPAQAFGVDFVLEIEGTKRFDKLPKIIS
ncbi:MAG: saccharopine dehydrogenase NADP-binding domain-containing protein [Ardenticatenaceae bacterium]|nr:saccharopine dehydrogenase NADP-binding domain-containing protein [Ardenticatenaceae bacterium]MCB9444919.1 saccharopine dehydrogenase NADP-binding domain-containing protein [Ardenticatenaceae bacterium]